MRSKLPQNKKHVGTEIKEVFLINFSITVSNFRALFVLYF